MSNKTKKSDAVKFELKTVHDLDADDSYKQHYKYNTILNNTLSNKAEDLLKCPKCDSENLYKSISNEHFECEECGRAIKKSDVKKEKK